MQGNENSKFAEGSAVIDHYLLLINTNKKTHSSVALRLLVSPRYHRWEEPQRG